jgi:hypothetical protein
MFDVDLDRTRFALQVRCVRIDSQGFVARWPKWGTITLNGRTIVEIKTTSNPNAKKRKDAAYDICSVVNRGENSFSINKHGDLETYVTGVYLIEKRSDQQIIDQFMNSEHIHRQRAVDSSKA